MSQTQVPTALLSVVKRDITPVRPLASPSRRALALLPLGLAGMPAFWHWQAHVKLAPWTWWGVSALEVGLSLIILASAFREAVPGRELSGRKLSALIIMSCAAFVLFNSGAQLPPATSTHDWMHWVWECIYMTISFSIPALAAPGWLVARALPNRPALAGALCGLGVGIMAEIVLLGRWHSPDRRARRRDRAAGDAWRDGRDARGALQRSFEPAMIRRNVRFTRGPHGRVTLLIPCFQLC